VSSSLRELEKRLAQEPDNLPLRVTVAGMLREAGRGVEAVEHYRRVAVAYRTQGRPQQAIAVCRSILELAPDDIAIHVLLAELTEPSTPIPPVPQRTATGTGDPPRKRTASAGEPTRTGVRSPPDGIAVEDPTRDPKRDDEEPRPPAAGSRPPANAFAKAALIPSGPGSRPSVPSPAGTRGAARTPAAGTTRPPPARRSSFETATPLPRPIPYHIADPTSSQMKLAREEAESAVDEALETRPGDAKRKTIPPELDTTGLAQAARRISSLITPNKLGTPTSSDLDLSAEVETRQRPRLSADDLAKVEHPPPTVPTEQVVLDDELPTPLPRAGGWTKGPPIRDTPIDPPTDLHPAARDTRPDHADEEHTNPVEPLDPTPIANAFFLALPQNRREAALARCIRREARAGSIVVRQGETSHPLILVVSGELELRVERANGTIARLDTIDMGQYTGEAALLGRTPATASLVAITDCELLTMPPHALFELAGAYPALWAALKDSAERRTRQYEKIIRG
jgi:hypothetical protein